MSHNDYGQGNGKAPTNGRWAKGQSGNPKGRPKKKKAPLKPSATDVEIREAFLRAAGGLMKFKENGSEVEMSVRSSMDRSQTFTGLKGNSHAQKNWIERDERLRKERAAEIAEDHERWIKYIVHDYKVLDAHYKKLGQPLPDEYPHPNELMFRDDQFVINYFGSKPHEAGKTRDALRKGRDVLLLQREKDLRHYRSLGMGEPCCMAEYLAIQFNAALVEPFRLSDTQLMIQMDRIRILKNIELNARLATAFEGLELPRDLNGISPRMDLIFRQWGIDVPNEKPPQRYRRAS